LIDRPTYAANTVLGARLPASMAATSTGHKHKQVAMFICIDNVLILNFKANDQRQRHSENTKPKKKPSETKNKPGVE